MRQCGLSELMEQQKNVFAFYQNKFFKLYDAMTLDKAFTKAQVSSIRVCHIERYLTEITQRNQDILEDIKRFGDAAREANQKRRSSNNPTGAFEKNQAAEIGSQLQCDLQQEEENSENAQSQETHADLDKTNNQKNCILAKNANRTAYLLKIPFFTSNKLNNSNIPANAPILSNNSMLIAKNISNNHSGNITSSNNNMNSLEKTQQQQNSNNTRRPQQQQQQQTNSIPRCSGQVSALSQPKQPPERQVILLRPLEIIMNGQQQPNKDGAQITQTKRRYRCESSKDTLIITGNNNNSNPNSLGYNQNLKSTNASRFEESNSKILKLEETYYGNQQKRPVSYSVLSSFDLSSYEESQLRSIEQNQNDYPSRNYQKELPKITAEKLTYIKRAASSQHSDARDDNNNKQQQQQQHGISTKVSWQQQQYSDAVFQQQTIQQKMECIEVFIDDYRKLSRGIKQPNAQQHNGKTEKGMQDLTANQVDTLISIYPLDLLPQKRNVPQNGRNKRNNSSGQQKSVVEVMLTKYRQKQMREQQEYFIGQGKEDQDKSDALEKKEIEIQQKLELTVGVGIQVPAVTAGGSNNNSSNWRGKTAKNSDRVQSESSSLGTIEDIIKKRTHLDMNNSNARIYLGNNTIQRNKQRLRLPMDISQREQQQPSASSSSVLLSSNQTGSADEKIIKIKEQTRSNGEDVDEDVRFFIQDQGIEKEEIELRQAEPAKKSNNYNNTIISRDNSKDLVSKNQQTPVKKQKLQQQDALSPSKRKQLQTITLDQGTQPQKTKSDMPSPLIKASGRHNTCDGQIDDGSNFSFNGSAAQKSSQSSSQQQQKIEDTQRTRRQLTSNNQQQQQQLHSNTLSNYYLKPSITSNSSNSNTQSNTKNNNSNNNIATMIANSNPIDKLQDSLMKCQPLLIKSYYYQPNSITNETKRQFNNPEAIKPLFTAPENMKSYQFETKVKNWSVLIAKDPAQHRYT